MAAQHSSWSFQDWSGSAAAFHALDLGYERALWLCEVTSPALILGSSQDVDVADEEVARALGIELVKRRSGGGAVFVHPEQSVWIDITISRDDPLWVDDVSDSMLWVGESFGKALSPWVDATVYAGSFESGTCGRSVCFSSSSPGEVFVGDKKLVGISQRRTRDGARFQCVLYSHWDVSQWLPALKSSDSAPLADLVPDIPVATVAASAHDIAHAVHLALPQ